MTEHTNQPTQHYDPPTVAPQAGRRRTWPWWLGIAAAAIIGITIGAAGSGSPEPEVQTVTVDAGEQRTTELDEREAELDERAEQLDTRSAELDERENAISGAEQQQAANTISDGIWTVGVDIEPGTYRAADVSTDCYWSILVTGSNGSDIVDNGIPGGGNPTVTLQEGHDFETNRCGEWSRQ